MNKYLVKAAEIMSEDNKTVAKTFAMQTAAGIPAHFLGGVAGGALGKKYLQGAADKINGSMGSAAKKLVMKAPENGVGRKAVTLMAKGLRKARGVDGKSLGVALGMSAVGGLADLGALHHGIKNKGEK